jgi:hypothetical protein
MSTCSQSHEAAFESYADASQSLPFRGSVEILPSTAQFTTALRENDRPKRTRCWLLIFRMFCKRESWAQHASTQPPYSGFKFVARSYNAGSVLLLVCCGGGCTQAVGPTCFCSSLLFLFKLSRILKRREK